MTEHDYDFVVIGGGSGGYAAARTACGFGLKTAVIDGAEELGGLCILRGCMPSKALIETANRGRAIRKAGRFGIESQFLGVNPAIMMERKRVLIRDFAGHRQGQLEGGPFDLIRGMASFTDSHRLEIRLRDGSRRNIAFRSACIATGSTIHHVSVPGLEEAGYWTSDDLLEAEALPDSMVVLGGGAIALEMACYLEGLGKKVVVIQRSEQLLSGADRDLAEALLKALQERENLSIYTGTKLESVCVNAAGEKEILFQHKSGARKVAAREILQALGRLPHSRPLKLEQAAVVADANGRILCNDRQQTSQPHIFAAGDVCGPHEVVHTAIEQGEKAARNAAIHLGRLAASMEKVDYRLKLLGIFTDPQVAMVGLTEAEARALGIEFRTASYPFGDHGKSMIMDEGHGFVKLIADAKTGELIGGSAVGPEAVELIHEIVVAMYFRATANEFLKIPHYHPTLSEIWTYPAEDLIIRDNLRQDCEKSL